jgi:hypothetical protein
MRRLLAALAMAVALMSVSSVAAASNDGKDRHVTIQNASTQAINNFYASPVTSTTWEEDLLGDRTIPPGQNTVANIDNGTNECNYDLMAVMANGRQVIRRAVNICTVRRWVVSDSGDSVQ